MAVSGSNDFNTTTQRIIRAAMSEIGVLAAGESPSAADYVLCRDRLNMMIKSWQAKQMGLWLNSVVVLFLEEGKTFYKLGSSGDRCVRFDDNTITKTTLSGVASSGQTTLSVDSTVGMNEGDHIGIVMDDLSIFWSTIPSGGIVDSETLVINDALTGSASSLNIVYFYTSVINRPVKIVDARFVDPSGNSQDIRSISRDEYMRIPVKSTSGDTLNYYDDPQLTNRLFYVYPVCGSDERSHIELSIREEVDDFDNQQDNANFPEEWHEAIFYNLALRLAAPFNVKLHPETALFAMQALDDARTNDNPSGPIYLQPEIS